MLCRGPLRDEQAGQGSQAQDDATHQEGRGVARGGIRTLWGAHHLEHRQHREGDARTQVEGRGVHARQEALVILRRVHHTQVIQHDIADTRVGHAQQDHAHDQHDLRARAHKRQQEQQQHGRDIGQTQQVRITHLRCQATSERAHRPTDQCVRGQEQQGRHRRPHAETSLRVLRQGRCHTVDGSEHARHRQDGGQQQTPGLAAAQVLRRDQRGRTGSVLLAGLPAPEDGEHDQTSSHQADDVQPIRGRTLTGLVRSQRDGQHRNDEDGRADPVHADVIGRLGLRGEHRDHRGGHCTDGEDQPEHGAEAPVLSHPAGEQDVDTRHATVDRGDQAHQRAEANLVLDLAAQDDQRHRDGRAGNTLQRAGDHQDADIRGEGGQQATQGHHGQHDDEDAAASHDVREAWEEQAAHRAAGEEGGLGQPHRGFVGVELRGHRSQHRGEHRGVELESHRRGDEHEHEQWQAALARIHRVDDRGRGGGVIRPA